MSTRISKGGCHCGRIRIEVIGEPIASVHCHCSDCQKITGAAAEAAALFPAENVKVTKGEPKSYPTQGESGENLHRYFCGNCSTPLIGKPDAMPNIASITIPSLDDSSFITEMGHIYTDHAASWTDIPKDAQKFPKMPPLG